jgi:hypothetical protein
VICPSCTSPHVGICDSRPIEGGATIRRRRVCTACGVRWTTYERQASEDGAAELTRLRALLVAALGIVRRVQRARPDSILEL